jgi:diaminopropionate ammonia-lyase
VPSRATLAGAGRVRSVFSADERSDVSTFFQNRPEIPATRLVSLPALAARLGCRRVLAKDESARGGLQAFKLLGARFAIDQLLMDGTVARGDVLVCASEGNHGRGVAHTARLVGCRARVYLSDSVAEARAEAIAAEGADVVRVSGSYDDAVRVAASEARTHGWTVISDTSYEGYERIPRLIMLGYTRLMDEVARDLPDRVRPDAIFVPGGVGGLLAAVAAWSHHRWGDAVSIVAVEPSSAACLQASARAGQPTHVPGPFNTIMGPLRCGDVSPMAFAVAFPLVTGYIAIDDDWTIQAMRQLASPTDGDPAVIAGASGGAALGGLLATLEDPAADDLRRALRLGPESVVLLIVSEGMTDPPLWHQVVGSR